MERLRGRCIPFLFCSGCRSFHVSRGFRHIDARALLFDIIWFLVFVGFAEELFLGDMFRSGLTRLSQASLAVF